MNCLICKKANHECIERALCVIVESYSANSNIPKNYRNVLVSDLETKRTVFEEIIEHYPIDSKSIKNVYLHSTTTGTGKTTTACSLLNEYLIYHVVSSYKKGISPNQVPIYFLDVNELQTLYNQFNRSNVDQTSANNASDEYYRRLKKAEVAEMVLFDDIGVRSSTDGFRGDLHGLINYRNVEKKPCIYTSNHSIERLISTYDARLYDRVRDKTIVINFDGKGSNRGEWNV